MDKLYVQYKIFRNFTTAMLGNVSLSKMENLVCLIVAIVFGVTTVKSEPNESKQVNLAIETVLNFDKDDKAPGVEAINNFQRLLNKVKDAINDKKQNFRRNTPETTLTDFVLNAAKIIRKYDDDDIKQAHVALQDEARSYVNNDKFYDYFGDDFRKYLSNQLDEFKDIPVPRLRRYLDIAVNAIENLEQKGDVTDLLEFGDYLFAGAKDKFDSALINLEKTRRSNTADIANALRHTLRSLVVDHYFSLDDNVQNELLNMVRHYWNAFGRNKENRSKLDIQDKNEEKEKASYVNKHKGYVKQKYKSDQAYVSDENNKYYDNKMKSKSSKKLSKIKERKTGRNKLVKASSQSENDETSYVSSSDGGKSDVSNVRFRGEEADELDKTEDKDDIQRPKEILIQHSNTIGVELSRKRPGRLNISFGAAKRFKPRPTKKKRYLSNRRQFNAVSVPGMISDIGLDDRLEPTSVLEDDDNLRRNEPQTLTTNDSSDNIRKQIEDIEKDIKKVKEKIKSIKKHVSGISLSKDAKNSDDNCSESASVEEEDIFWSGSYENTTHITANEEFKSPDLRRDNNIIKIEETTKENYNVTVKNIEPKKGNVDSEHSANKGIELLQNFQNSEAKLDENNNINDTTIMNDHSGSQTSNDETDASSYLQDDSKNRVISDSAESESLTKEDGTVNNFYETE